MKIPQRPPVAIHSISDHALGADADHVHEHGGDYDHDHDHDGSDDHSSGAGDDLVLTSIGMDVGSSGTQVMFVRLGLGAGTSAPGAQDGAPDEPSDGTEALAPPARRDPLVRTTLYQSPVFLTPFVEGGLIDERRLDEILESAFAAANLTPDDIDCGVVILTGAARLRANAEFITRTLAERCGDIVSASAGHHMEARIAAHGSGAVERSALAGTRFLNIDIGGATTKLAVCEHGRVTATAALEIGGRTVATDNSDTIVRLDPSAAAQAEEAGYRWHLGGLAPWPERRDVAERLAARLVDALAGRLSPPALEALSLTGPLPSFDGVAGIVVSGGVGEYVYGRETRSFGDLGLALGRALAGAIDRGEMSWPLMPAGECIRATALGAAAYSVQLSGRTGHISSPSALLPRRNLPVVRPRIDWGSTGLADFDAPTDAKAGRYGGPDAAGIAAAVATSLSEAELRADTEVVVALDWQGPPEHARIYALAAGVKRGFRDWIAAGTPLYVILEADIAASLGAVLADELGVTSPLLVLDGIALDDLDHVDLGRIRLPSGTVPLVIKSLAFRREPGQKTRATRRGSRTAGRAVKHRLE